MAAYDFVADDYDKSFQLLPVRSCIEAYSVLRLVGDVRGLEVLDVACGTGLYARALRRAGATRVVGVDIAEMMVNVARQIEEETKLGIEYRVADAAAFESLGTFDLAVAVYLLHYAPTLEALRAMASNIARSLKPGGRLVSFSLNPDLATHDGAYAAYGLSLRIPEDSRGDGAPLHFAIKTPEVTTPEFTIFRWSKPTVEAALDNAGLRDVRWEKPDVDPTAAAKHGHAMWQPYLEAPHCLLLSAMKPKS